MSKLLVLIFLCIIGYAQTQYHIEADYHKHCVPYVAKDFHMSNANSKKICKCSYRTIKSIYTPKHIQYIFNGVGGDLEIAADLSFSKLVDVSIENCVVNNMFDLKDLKDSSHK